MKTPNSDKRFYSFGYRRKIKQLTAMVKELRGISRIPNLSQRPIKDKAKQEAFDQINATRVDKSVIHFFCSPYTVDDFRQQSRSVGEKIDQVIKDVIPKSSLKY